LPAAVAAAATGGLTAAWVAQHRAVQRAAEAARRGEQDEGLELPGDLVHHDVTVGDGGTVHVVERGSGPVLLLLHGFMLCSDVWVHQLTDLTARHRVVAVDLRGHGRSMAGPAGFRAPGETGDPAELTEVAPMAVAGEGAPAVVRLAADVRAVVAALDLRDALLVGHSMGGMVALQLLAAMDDDERHRRFRGVALVSTTAGPYATMPGWSRLARTMAPLSSRALLLAERVGATSLPAEDLRWWLTRLGFGPEAAPAQVRFVEQLHAGAPQGTLAGLIPSLALFDLSARLDDIDLPALVVVGSRDRLTSLRHARRMVEALPRAELVELPRCGHMPMLERRHEFSRLLEEFCAKVA
jgi:pimeloyl-ACP methyl ester carboxylesterase